MFISFNPKVWRTLGEFSSFFMLLRAPEVVTMDSPGRVSLQPFSLGAARQRTNAG
jgi:hypothetical protein